MTNIHQLIPDIYRLVGKRDGWFNDEIASSLGTEIALKMQMNFGERKEQPTLRLSKSGPICPRHLWFSMHKPELAEPFSGPTIIKFAYGHTIEALAIALAKAAGHEVTGEQDELSVLGVKGHRDCVLDGCIVDVKSCSDRMFQKFEKKTIQVDDPFGYLDQLDGYLVGSANDDLVRVKDKAYIWAIDKVLGKMVLYEHRLRQDSIIARITKHKQVVGLSSPPPCECGTKPYGESGNVSLDTKASYSSFKKCCFPELRTFVYGKEKKSIVHLVKVVRTPDVPEITRQPQPWMV